MLSEKFNIEELETTIPIDTSVEDWIREMEEIMKLKEFSEMRCSLKK